MKRKKKQPTLGELAQKMALRNKGPGVVLQYALHFTHMRNAVRRFLTIMRDNGGVLSFPENELDEETAKGLDEAFLVMEKLADVKDK